MGSFLWNLIKLVVTISLVGGFLFAIKVIVTGINEAVAGAKDKLAGKGVNITKDGVAVKTERRALTQEETQDRLQKGLMKGWKASSFEVPYVLSKASNLAGSSHDKSKDAWEAKHGPKANKT